MVTDTHTEEKKRIAGQLFEMERQKLDLFTTNQSLSKENNELKEINANYQSEISKMNEQRAKDQKENEELKLRISQLETEAREVASNMRKTIYKKERELEDVEKLLADMQEEPYMDLEASCEQKH